MDLAYPLETFRTDFARHVEFLKNCTVDHVPLYYTCGPDEREKFWGPHFTLEQTAEIFREQVAEIRRQGLKIDVVYSGGPMAETVLSDAQQQEQFQHTCELGAEQGIRIIGLSVPNPAREATDEVWFANLVAGYQWLADRAAEYDLKICSHCGTAWGRRFYSAEDLEQLLGSVGRDNNGLLFCFGNLALAGMDVPEMIRRFSDSIFAVHLRQVKGSFQGEHEEVQFHDGLIDLPESLRALQEIGYDGVLHPEHFPRFSTMRPSEECDLWVSEYEDGPTLAWTLGYVRALMKVVL